MSDDLSDLYDLVRDDPRYPVEAYQFLCDAMSFTQEALGRDPRDDDDPDGDFHISGEEVTRGACVLAVQEFGMMAPVVFKLWNVRATDDIGAIMFNLVKAGRLAPSDADDIADFHDLFDLDKALADGFELTTTARKPGKGSR